MPSLPPDGTICSLSLPQSADGQRDFFFEADSREEKAQWMTVLRLYTNLTSSRRGRTDTGPSAACVAVVPCDWLYLF